MYIYLYFKFSLKFYKLSFCEGIWGGGVADLKGLEIGSQRFWSWIPGPGVTAFLRERDTYDLNLDKIIRYAERNVAAIGIKKITFIK